MTWTVTTLLLGEVELNRRRMIANATGNGLVRVPVQGWLLMRGSEAIVIDTGFRHPDILKRLGDSAAGVEKPEQRVVRQLALHGVEPGDVRYVLHTHLHIDHAGQTDEFPLATTAVVAIGNMSVWPAWSMCRCVCSTQRTSPGSTPCVASWRTSRCSGRSIPAAASPRRFRMSGWRNPVSITTASLPRVSSQL